MHALAHGDVVAAIGLNVLAVAALPLLATLWWRWTARLATGQERTTAASSVLIWALLAVVVVYGVVRNLPFGAVLAP
jgi:hypothetical protein